MSKGIAMAARAVQSGMLNTEWRASAVARLCLYTIAMACAGGLAGCMPTSVTFQFGDDSMVRRTPVDELSAPAGERAESGGSGDVALIDVRGLLLDSSSPGLFGSTGNPTAELAARLRAAAEDSRVKAVVLRMNTPGGGVTASETMHSIVRRFRESTGKPVVISMGDVCASGGYYLSTAGDYVVAQPTGITASIGVIIPTVNFSEGMRRIGIVSRSIKSGANKDLANPLEPMREPQFAVLQGMVDEFYAKFRAMVVEARKSPGAVRTPGGATLARAALDMARLDELTDGRVMSGAQAVRAGLADAEGDLIDSLHIARRLAGLSSARVVRFHRSRQTPTTVYGAPEELAARGPASAGQTGGGDINLISLHMAPGPDQLSTGGAYYLWMPGQ